MVSSEKIVGSASRKNTTLPLGKIFLPQLQHAVRQTTGGKSKDIHTQDELNNQWGKTPTNNHPNGWNGLQHQRGQSTQRLHLHSSLDLKFNTRNHKPISTPGYRQQQFQKEKVLRWTYHQHKDPPGPANPSVLPSTFGSPTAWPTGRDKKNGPLDPTSNIRQ